MDGDREASFGRRNIEQHFFRTRKGAKDADTVIGISEVQKNGECSLIYSLHIF